MPDVCSSCGHPISMGMCWRLTCPTNGATVSFDIVRDAVKADCAKGAQRLMRSSLFDPEPPEKALAFVFDDDEEDDAE